MSITTALDITLDLKIFLNNKVIHIIKDDVTLVMMRPTITFLLNLNDCIEANFMYLMIGASKIMEKNEEFSDFLNNTKNVNINDIPNDVNYDVNSLVDCELYALHYLNK